MNTVEYAKKIIKKFNKYGNKCTVKEKLTEKNIIPHRFDIRVFASYEPHHTVKFGCWTILAPCLWSKSKDEPGLIVGFKKLDEDWELVLVWYESIGRWGIVPMGVGDELEKCRSIAEWIWSNPYCYQQNPDVRMDKLIKYMYRDKLENILHCINYM